MRMTKTTTKTVTNVAATKDRAMRSFFFYALLLKRPILIGFLVIACVSFAITVDGLSDNVQRSDVAVILGSKVETSGRPSARLAARLDRAVALYNTSMARTLIVSGGTGKEGYNEAFVMRDYLAARGVPSSDIIVDGIGRTTEATAQHCASIMKGRGFKSIIIVTQYFHVSRTRMALRFNGVRLIHSAHARFFELRDIYSTVREAVALPVYWLRRL